MTNNGEQLVSSIYKENVYSSQFNVRLNKLPQEIDNTKQFIIRSFYLSCFSNLEIYSRDIYNFVTQFKNLSELHTKSSPITQLIENLSLRDCFAEEEINTLIYLRLRRNALIHRDSKKVARGELIEHIKANGKILNKYWMDKKVKIKSLDFTKKNNLYSFHGDIAIEMINIIRLLAEKIDSLLLQQIEANKLMQFLLEDFRNTYSKLPEIKNRIKRFNHFTMIEYGATFDEQTIKSLLGE